MKIVLTRIKNLTLKVHITVFAMFLVLMQIDETCINADWFYMPVYGVFKDGAKVTKSCSPDNFTQWIFTRSEDYTINCPEKVMGMHLFSFYFSSSNKSIIGKSVSTVDVDLNICSEGYSAGVDVERYQSASQHAMSKVDFSIGTGIY